LEGLEVSILNFKDILIDNENKRIDSEYFKKQFLQFFQNVPNLRSLGSFVKSGYRVVYENTKIINKEEAEEKEFPIFLQAADLETPFIRTENLFHVDNVDWERYPKGRISKGEILIEVKGKIDKVAIVPDDFPEKTLVTGSLFKLTVNEKISKNVLLTYLISKYGVAFKERYKTNLLISFISKPDLYRIPVPSFSKEFETKIDDSYTKIFDFQKSSKQLYTQAEELLLETLGLQNFATSREAVNVKSLKESFLSSGRLDAEYYQPKYEDLFNHITNTNHKVLGSLVNIKKSVEPGSSAYQEEGIPFMRVSNLNKFGISDPEIYLDSILFDDVIRPKKDVILLSKDGSIGIAYKAEKDLNCITSGAILHLEVESNEVLPDYLTLVLNSLIVKLQAERDSGGSIIQHWKPSEIQKVIIPIIEKKIQQQIADLIQKSFALKAASEELLETSKRAVEIAIEENEETALAFISKNTKSYGH